MRTSHVTAVCVLLTLATGAASADDADDAILRVAQDKSTVEQHIARYLQKQHGLKAEQRYADRAKTNVYLVLPYKPEKAPAIEILVDTSFTSRGARSGKVMAQAIVVKAYHELGDRAKPAAVRTKLLELFNLWNTRRFFISASVDDYGYLLLKGNVNMPREDVGLHAEVVADLIVRLKSAWDRFWPAVSGVLGKAEAGGDTADDEAAIAVPKAFEKTVLADRAATAAFLAKALPSITKEQSDQYVEAFWSKEADFQQWYKLVADNQGAILVNRQKQRWGIVVPISKQGFPILPLSVMAKTFVPTGVTETAKAGWYERASRRLAVRGECQGLAVFKDGSALLCAWMLSRNDPTKVRYGYRKLAELTADVKAIDLRLAVGGATVKGLGEKATGSLKLIDAVE